MGSRSVEIPQLHMGNRAQITGQWGPDIVVLYYKAHTALGRAHRMPQSAFVSALGPLQ